MKMEIQRCITVDAPLEKVRALIEDFEHWSRWSPWTILEPGCTVSVSGNPRESGHTMQWQGELIGSGHNSIRNYSETRLDFDLVFLKPWKSKADVSFLLKEVEQTTEVTWTMHSSMPFFLFFMVKTMENMVGLDYERGLRMLKSIAETGEVPAETINAGLVDYEGFSYIGIKRSCSFEAMPELMQKDFENIVHDIVIGRGKSAMHWVGIYLKHDLKTMQATYIAAISDENLADLDLGDTYIRGKLNTGKALEIKHNGPYDFIGNAWSMGMMYIRGKKLKSRGVPYEQYWNSPMEESPANLKTSIYFPIKD